MMTLHWRGISERKAVAVAVNQPTPLALDLGRTASTARPSDQQLAVR